MQWDDIEYLRDDMLIEADQRSELQALEELSVSFMLCVGPEDPDEPFEPDELDEDRRWFEDDSEELMLVRAA